MRPLMYTRAHERLPNVVSVIGPKEVVVAMQIPAFGRVLQITGSAPYRNPDAIEMALSLAVADSMRRASEAILEEWDAVFAGQTAPPELSPEPASEPEDPEDGGDFAHDLTELLGSTPAWDIIESAVRGRYRVQVMDEFYDLSMADIVRMTLEDLADIPGVGVPTAERILGLVADFVNAHP